MSNEIVESIAPVTVKNAQIPLKPHAASAIESMEKMGIKFNVPDRIPMGKATKVMIFPEE